MGKWSDSFFEGVDTFFAWLSTSLKQTTESYCELETADSSDVLVNHDGSLLSILKIEGITSLAGAEEFQRLVEGLTNSFQGAMSRPGHALQVYFSHDKQNIKKTIQDIYAPADSTMQRLELDLNDLFEERVNYLSQYCADENVYFVLMTRPFNLPSDQIKAANKAKVKMIKDKKAPSFKNSQTIFAAIPELRDTHSAYVRSIMNDLDSLNILAKLLEVHEAVHAIRMTADPDFTADDWRPTLPGDTIPVRETNNFQGDVSDLLWPSLAKQVIPRDAEIIDRRTILVGNKMYSSAYIDLFPKDIKPFLTLFSRILPTHIPWRISFLLESEGLTTIKLKGMFVSGMLATTTASAAVPAIAPLSEVISMLPILRPASPWRTGALLYRSPDGKPWPFQPGSSHQTCLQDSETERQQCVLRIAVAEQRPCCRIELRHRTVIPVAGRNCVRWQTV